ncbi:MAG TPA: glycosyltransferase family 4 protein [Gaiellaceae bacterium]|nr:glycosyltransferase family 4 protein [Gaiellaceae bacterium]
MTSPHDGLTGLVARAGASLDWRTRPVRQRLRLAADLVAARVGSADVALFHEFAPPPGGGGHQFLRGLVGELERRGLRVERNRLSSGTPCGLLNSFNFELGRLRAFAHPGARLVHRVDGPVGVYRGVDDGTDAWIARVNRELAQATVFQSLYSLERHRELGFEFVDPVVIHNAPDPAIFHPSGRVPFDSDRRVRVVATSWSDNPRKGAPVLKRIEELLDPAVYELTFVGRSAVRFERFRALDPLPPGQLAALLRAHDVFLTASLDEACSNALLEALACGLPTVYVRSGSNGELVGEAGFGFDEAEEVPALLDRLREEYAERQSLIEVPNLTEVADRYLEVLHGA